MAVLRHNAFRNLFLAQSASTIGDRIVFVALALYVTEIGSPTDVGLVLAAHALPLIGFLLVGGVLADRMSRTRVMIACDFARCVLHALLAVLIVTGDVEIWHIVVIEALYGCAEAFFKPAQTGLLPQTVPEEEIQEARAASGTMETIAEFAGPSLATALVLGLGAGWAFAIDAATFLVSIAFLLRVRARRRGDVPVGQTMLADLREGWGAVRERAWLWSILVCFSIAVLLSFAPWFTLGPTVAERVYGSTGVFGVLSGGHGRRHDPGRADRLPLAAAAPDADRDAARAPVAAVLAGVALGLPIGMVVPTFVLGGFGIALFGIWWETALAERVPPHLLCVSAYDWLVSLSLLPLGYLLAGPLGEALGVQTVLAAGAALATLALAAGLLVRETRTLRRLERRRQLSRSSRTPGPSPRRPGSARGRACVLREQHDRAAVEAAAGPQGLAARPAGHSGSCHRARPGSSAGTRGRRRPPATRAAGCARARSRRGSRTSRRRSTASRGAGRARG